VSELTDFVLRMIAEDEAAAETAVDACSGVSELSPHWEAEVGHSADGRAFAAVYGAPVQASRQAFAGVAEHIARHDPARVLAECAAYREIVELHTPEDYEGALCTTCNDLSNPYLFDGDRLIRNPCDTLRALASVWAGHSEFDPEWGL
jgi:hypothetical protein